MDTNEIITGNYPVDRSPEIRKTGVMGKARSFKQADVERAIRAATKAGLAVGSVEVTADGTIRILTAQAGAVAQAEDAFGAWKAKRCA